MTPNEFPDLFSVITLGTATSPGTVTLSGHDRNPSWDVASAKGQTGASSTLNGASVGRFTATFYLASAADQIAWPAFQRVVESTIAQSKPTALPVYHPDLAANHFAEVCAESIGGAVRDPRGGVTVTIKFIEFLPPKPAQSKTATGGTGGKVDPNAARKAQLDALLEEAKKP